MTDHEVLVTIVTAFLIREGGSITFSKDEWDQASEHQGSLYFRRQEETDPMLVALMSKVKEVMM